MKKQSSENKLVITEEFIFDQNKLSKDLNNQIKTQLYTSGAHAPASDIRSFRCLVIPFMNCTCQNLCVHHMSSYVIFVLVPYKQGRQKHGGPEFFQ